MWITSMCNHGAAGGISECRLSSCSSCNRLCLWVCVSVYVYQSRACPHDNHHPFKLWSQHLDQRCKTPWLRSLLFWGMINTWPSRSNLTWKSNFTYFELVCTITPQPFKLGSPNLDRTCIYALLKSLLILDLIDFDLHFHFPSWNLFSTKFICTLFVSYLVRPIACKH